MYFQQFISTRYSIIDIANNRFDYVGIDPKNGSLSRFVGEVIWVDFISFCLLFFFYISF